jgi:glycosyltransferase involved in cell wall biosynthesis
MKIGIFISPAHAVPPTEMNILAPWMLTSDLANRFVGLGHQVTLFAAKGSKTDATLVHANVLPTSAVEHRYADKESYRSFVIAQELLLFREVIARAKAQELDIVHVHQPVERLYPALAALPQRIPVVITFHDPISPARFPALEKLLALKNIYFVSLSQSQQRGVPFPFAAVVPNGVDTSVFVPDGIAVRQKPLLITGRIVPEKGFTDAIEAAAACHERLLIVGQEYSKRPDSLEYFEHEIAPRIDKKQVLWESVVRREHLIGHYQTAKALLFPIHWEEPFGLVMIEAMACGLPVIAYHRGSVSEIIRDGLTGYIIDEGTEGSTNIPNPAIKTKGIAGLVEAIGKIDAIDPKKCREHVEKHFSTDTMIKAYIKVYKDIIKSHK